MKFGSAATQGVFSIESHAHRHALVHTSSRLAGFADPNTLSHFDYLRLAYA